MEDLSQVIANFMNDKDSVAKLQNLTQMLQKSDNKANVQEKNSENENVDESPISAEMMQKIMKIMPLISSAGQEDKNSKLLAALRPHLSEARQTKLDKSMKILKLMKVLPALKGQEFF